MDKETFPDSGAGSKRVRSLAEEAILKRAFSYPYARPNESYLFREGGSHPMPKSLSPNLHFVLAIGSNGSPEQLRRKYGDEVSIPVVRVMVEGLDVVYAGIMSGYGSIPATIVKSLGTVTRMYGTLLTDGELRRMHETEGGYYFCRLVDGMGVRVLCNGQVVNKVFCYVARRGALCNEQIFGLGEVQAQNRRFAIRSQREAQMMVKALVGWEEDVEEFVLRNVGNKERREKVMRCMKGTEDVEDCFEVAEDIGRVIRSVK